MKTLELTSPIRWPAPIAAVIQIEAAVVRPRTETPSWTITAQSAYRSKHWLGYAKPDQVAGDRLLAYLEERATPTAAMEKVAKARRDAAARVPLRQKALNYLAGQIGDKEHPAGSNGVSLASEWYGLIGPWCAMAVTRACVETSSQAFLQARRYAYVPFIVNDAHAGANDLR